MTSKRLNLAYITNDSMRKSTFKKRRNGLFKDVHELSVLCGVEACAVIYSPFSSNPEIWPSNSGVKNVLEKFENVPEIKQEMKLVNHEDFLRQIITKTMENNRKKMKDNKERTLKEAMFHILRRGNNLQLTDQSRDALCEYIDQYLNKLYFHRKQTLNQSHLEYGESSSVANVMAPSAIAEVGSSFFSNLDVLNSPQLVNESWVLNPTISSSQRPEQINSFGSNFCHAANNQQRFYQMMNPVGVYDQHPNLNLSHDQYEQKFGGYLIVAQDGMMNPVGVYDHHPNLNLNEDQYAQKFGGYSIVDQNGMMNPVGVYDQHPNLNLNLDRYEKMFVGNPIVTQDGMMNPVGVYDQHPNLNPNQGQCEQKFGGYPTVAQDGIHKLNQMMMNHPHQMCFPMIDDNNRYFHQQS